MKATDGKCSGEQVCRKYKGLDFCFRVWADLELRGKLAQNWLIPKRGKKCFIPKFVNETLKNLPQVTV